MMSIGRGGALLVAATIVSLSAAARADGDAEVARGREVLVTASRLVNDVESTGSTVTVLPAAELEAKQIRRVEDALRIVPGAYLSRAGAPGSPSSLFLRGAGSNQTVVLVDGVQVNDPTIGGQFNFYDLNLDNVERVEVLRGSASTFYGSDALGGVVNVETRRGRGDPTFSASAEAGSFGHRRGFLEGRGDLGVFDFSTAVSHTRWGNDLRNHEYRDMTFAGAIGFEPGAFTRIELRGRWIDSEAHDPWEFPFGAKIEEDENIRRDRRTALGALVLRQDLGDRLSLEILGSLFDVRSRYENGPDAPGAAPELTSRSDAEVRTATLTGAWSAPDPADWATLRLMAGFEAEDQATDTSSESPFGPGPAIDRTVRNRAGFLLVETELFDRLTLSGGYRVDRNSFFGSEGTASGTVRYCILSSGTVFRANYGEGFRAPTPAEFSDPFVGNEDLGPERSIGVDAGIEQPFLDRDLVFRATWFQLLGRDTISYDAQTMRLENLAKAKTRGWELEAVAHPSEDLTIRGFLTVQDPENESAGPGESRRLPGRPKSFGGGDVALSVGDFSFGASVYASTDYPGTGKIAPDGSSRDHPGRKLLVGLRAEWEAAEGIRVKARVENLLDDDWYDSETAPDGLGRGFYVGAEVRF